MSTQNYANHTRLDTLYHKILLPVLFLTLIGACVNLYQVAGRSSSGCTARR